jgi:hypothetical protein
MFWNSWVLTFGELLALLRFHLRELPVLLLGGHERLLGGHAIGDIAHRADCAVLSVLAVRLECDLDPHVFAVDCQEPKQAHARRARVRKVTDGHGLVIVIGVPEPLDVRADEVVRIPAQHIAH